MEFIELPDCDSDTPDTSPMVLVPVSRIVSIRLEVPDPDTYRKERHGSSVHDRTVGYGDFVLWMSETMREPVDGEHEKTDPLLLMAAMTVEVMMEKESVLFELSEDQMAPVMRILDDPDKEFGMKAFTGYLDVIKRLDDFSTWDDEDEGEDEDENTSPSTPQGVIQ